ncbi:Eukaryotic peptide chain release factor subunit 1-1 [Acorus calamus]|uniref:Eukaryotic peptide chain release factor subunit 1-1 n=1 Tax=Acorus calamus TaxID=4465 RepID=A0AAV9EPG9_ACOCL|nr:Eukaryotic peptide chain release factor subunit 1-1 [Acorus calamus]
MKKLIKALDSAREKVTSMNSLSMPPRDQVSRVMKMLGDEFGTASNIKRRVNQQSVLGAITSAQERLKPSNKAPLNGLVLYTGAIITEEATIDFEPFNPIDVSLYFYDNKFHTELWRGEWFQPDHKSAEILSKVDMGSFDEAYDNEQVYEDSD